PGAGRRAAHRGVGRDPGVVQDDERRRRGVHAGARGQRVRFVGAGVRLARELGSVLGWIGRFGRGGRGGRGAGGRGGRRRRGGGGVLGGGRPPGRATRTGK